MKRENLKKKKYAHCATIYIKEVYTHTHTHTSEDYIKNVLIVKIGELGVRGERDLFFPCILCTILSIQINLNSLKAEIGEMQANTQ